MEPNHMKRTEFEDTLDDAQYQQFTEIMEERELAQYEDGFRDGQLEADIPDSFESKLRARLNYLRVGGTWQIVDETNNAYVNGFLDAMRTLEGK
jgi:hypothetical protein